MADCLSNKFPTLFHYTNESGLYGILESDFLWGKNFQFLNDTTELQLFNELLTRYLNVNFRKEFEQQMVNEDFRNLVNFNGGIDKSVEETVQALITGQNSALFNSLEAEFYITSFCGHHVGNDYSNNNGLLSQWRGYGGNGGYAIEFDTSILEEELAIEATTFGNFIVATKVFYNNNEDAFLHEFERDLVNIKTFAIDIFEKIKNHVNEYDPSEDIVKKGLESLVKCMPSYKHQGFSEEQEVRFVVLISKRIDDTEKKLTKKRKFGEGPGRRIPYIELFNRKEQKLPIKRIIVGPHKDKDCRAESLKIWLRSHGRDIEVRVSETPFLDSQFGSK